jgi:predicted transcriptional regulator
MDSNDRTLVIDPRRDLAALKALASAPRAAILEALGGRERNVNELAEVLSLPQSTVATHLAQLEAAGLVGTRTVAARKGTQKLCRRTWSELVVRFAAETAGPDGVETEMPIGLFTNFRVDPPCGLASPDGLVGYLDVPDAFLHPDRMKAGLLWLSAGFVEYKFPNNARYQEKPVRSLELAAELSSETPGTNPDWPSDIALAVNGVEVGVWTSPGDFGDKRGKHTPAWWKLEGSQYGLLKRWTVTAEGSFVDGVRVSGVRLADLHLADHHSVRIRLGVDPGAVHRGGMNLFGRGFGNYGRGLALRLGF